MSSTLAHISEIEARKILGLEMGGDFAAPLGDKLLGGKTNPHLCGGMHIYFATKKTALLNVNAGLAQILRTDF